MTREEAKRVLKTHLEHWQRLTKEKICTKQEGAETISAFDMAIEALKQEPITDRIEYGTDGNSYKLTISNGKEFKQEPKTGHWIVDERPESNREIICTNCEQPIFKYHNLDFDYRPNFCPNCGADMRGEV